MSQEAVFIVSLSAVVVAVVLTAAVTLRTLLPRLQQAPGESIAPSESSVPVKVICPRTTLPTLVQIARRPAPDLGLQVLACAEFDGAPSCEQPCVSMGVPLVQA